MHACACALTVMWPSSAGQFNCDGCAGAGAVIVRNDNVLQNCCVELALSVPEVAM